MCVGDLLDLCTAEQGFKTLGNTLCMCIETVCAHFLFLCSFVMCKCMFKSTQLEKANKGKLIKHGLCGWKSSLLWKWPCVCMNRNITWVCACIHAGLRDMLQMITHQWQELQRQIRRQHGWILRTLDTIKAQILATERDEEPKNTEDPNFHASSEVWSINPATWPNLRPISCTTSLFGSFLLSSFQSHSTPLS